eukprot:scaffold1280_cov379-Prasinococcus_capsulatus_cf.AAC.16
MASTVLGFSVYVTQTTAPLAALLGPAVFAARSQHAQPPQTTPPTIVTSVRTLDVCAWGRHGQLGVRRPSGPDHMYLGASSRTRHDRPRHVSCRATGGDGGRSGGIRPACCFPRLSPTCERGGRKHMAAETRSGGYRGFGSFHRYKLSGKHASLGRKRSSPSLLVRCACPAARMSKR